jgi:hypothetical protein
MRSAPVSGQSKGSKVGKTQRDKGTKLMVITDASGLSLAAQTSASSYEVPLIEATFAETVDVG